MFSSSRIVYINSEERLTGTNEDFTVALSMSPNEDYDRCCVLYGMIPISYYLVDSNNNTFTLREGAVNTVISIPIGNYSANSFATVVTGLLNTVSPNHWVYAISLNNTFTKASDGKFYFTVTGNSSQPSFIFTNHLYEQFGFSKNSTNTFVSNALVSTYVLSFIPETAVYLHSDIVDTKDNNGTSMLQEFYGENSVSFSNIVYQCKTVEEYSKPLKKGFSNSISFTLIDQHGGTLNLNGRPFFITLLLYKSNDFFDIIKRYIKLNLLNS